MPVSYVNSILLIRVKEQEMEITPYALIKHCISEGRRKNLQRFSKVSISYEVWKMSGHPLKIKDKLKEIQCLVSIFEI